MQVYIPPSQYVKHANKQRIEDILSKLNRLLENMRHKLINKRGIGMLVITELITEISSINFPWETKLLKLEQNHYVCSCSTNKSINKRKVKIENPKRCELHF